MNRGLSTSGLIVVLTALGAQAAAAQTVPRIELRADIGASTIAGRDPGSVSKAVGGAGSVSASPGLGCANQPLTQNARIWTLMITGIATTFDSGSVTAVSLLPGVNVPVFGSTDGTTLVVPLLSAETTEVTLSRAGRTFRGRVYASLGALKVRFADLTLAEASDLLDQVDQLPDVMNVTVTTYVIPIASVTGATDPRKAYMTLMADVDPVRQPAAFEAALKAKDGAPKRSAPVTVSFSTDVDRNSVLVTKDNIRGLSGFVPSTSELSAGTGVSTPIFVIEEPCLQFNLAPVSTDAGSSSSKFAVSFRGRYDFLEKDGRNFAKLRAEGDGGKTSNQFDRLQGYIDIGRNLAQKTGLLAFGGTASYSFRRDDTGKIDQWQAGGKFQYHAPSLAGPLGAGTSPIVSLTAGAVGGTGTTKNAFQSTLDITATRRIDTRFSLDLRANGSLASRQPFAGRSHYGYVHAQIRFNVAKDVDYLVKYECGRKEPDYRRYCGVQSGLSFLTGR